VYLTPSDGCFMASFALGDKAVEAVRRSGLPPRVIRILDEAKKYAEGTAVRIDVTAARDIGIVKKIGVREPGITISANTKTIGRRSGRGCW